MPYMNTAYLMGHLGQDPKIMKYPTGMTVGKFSVATKTSWKGKEDEWKSKTEWHNVTVFGPQAERLEGKLFKGDLVMVTGKISYSEYETKDGVKKTSTEINADNLQIFPRVEKLAPLPQDVKERQELAKGILGDIPMDQDVPKW